MNKLLNHLPSWLKNKYFISFAAFCMIILFLAKNDLVTQLERKKELHNWNKQKSYYTQEINRLEKEYQALTTTPAAIEKLAREKFFMKRDNEELFIISEKSDPAKN